MPRLVQKILSDYTKTLRDLKFNDVSVYLLVFISESYTPKKMKYTVAVEFVFLFYSLSFWEGKAEHI